MRQSLRYASWLLLLFILLSCSHRVTGEATALPPILQAEAQSQKYNLQLDFMKHHFSGMLIVRQMPDNEIRILGSTYFGLSLFDFSLHRDTFIVNSCMEPMRKKKMLKILETDFKNLFLKSEKARIKKKSSTFEQRISGKGFGKTAFTLSNFVNGQAEKVQIKHPLIRLRIQLDKLNINNP